MNNSQTGSSEKITAGVPLGPRGETLGGNPEQADGQAVITGSLEDIDVVEKRVTHELGIAPGTAEAVTVTDEALVAIAEHTITSPWASEADRVDVVQDVAVETALEMDAGAPPDHTALARFQPADYPKELREVAEVLAADHATLPSGHEAAPLLTEAIQKLSNDPVVTEPGDIAGTVEYVKRSKEEDAAVRATHGLSRIFQQRVENMSMLEKASLENEVFIRLEKIPWNQLSLQEATSLMNELSAADRCRDDRNDAFDDEVGPRSFVLESLKEYVPADVARKLYDAQDENGETSSMKQYVDDCPLTPYRLDMLRSVLSKVYEPEGGYRGVPQGEDGAVDRMCEYGAVRSIETIPTGPQDPSDLGSVADYEIEVEQAFVDAWRDLRLSDAFGRDFLRAAESRMMRRMDGDATNSEGAVPYIDGRKMQGIMIKVWYCINGSGIGAPTFERLHGEVGLVNIDRYKPEDIRGIVKFLDKDEAFLRHLRQGDVTVSFTDAYGDHNGALVPTVDTYRKDSGRSLAFEVGSEGDIYRRLVQLKQRGIKPSMIVLAAHGSPGSTLFGAPGNGGFRLSALPSLLNIPSMETVSLGDAQVSRVVSEYMQPNRGVDCTPEQVGRREVIINSCSGDVEYMRGLPSTTELIARMAGVGTDVYGASNVLYVSPTRLAEGGSAVEFKRKTEAGEFVGATNKVTAEGRQGILGRTKTRLMRSRVQVYGREVPRREGLDELKIKRTHVDRIVVDASAEFKRETA